MMMMMMMMMMCTLNKSETEVNIHESDKICKNQLCLKVNWLQQNMYRSLKVIFLIQRVQVV